MHNDNTKSSLSQVYSPHGCEKNSYNIKTVKSCRKWKCRLKATVYLFNQVVPRWSLLNFEVEYYLIRL